MRMKSHKKFTLIVFVVLCCFFLTTCRQKDASVSSVNDATSNTTSSTQISSKPSTQTTDKTNTTVVNTTVSTTVNTTLAESTKKIIETAKPVPPEYFDDAVFVGDSVSQGLRNYVAYAKDTLGIDYFGKAEYLTALDFGSYNALQGNCLPVYKGEKIPVEDNIAQMDVKKVYILLGLNDIYLDTDTVVKNYQEFINLILAKKPGLDIIIESVTPITRFEESNPNKDNPYLTRANVNALNAAYKKMADKNGYYFLNVGSAVVDSEGYLPDEYSFDGTCHMRPEALELWINYLRTHIIGS
ncbi:MAG: GDSL-type esterase/lipase family protein [Oscillospiraceae bacterium]|nr:GDSL-type esterase/lipase family protein [Oscillospiraceae bacterium]